MTADLKAEDHALLCNIKLNFLEVCPGKASMFQEVPQLQDCQVRVQEDRSLVGSAGIVGVVGFEKPKTVCFLSGGIRNKIGRCSYYEYLQ